MHDAPLTPIPDLAYWFDPNGPWIDLEQSADCGEVSRITMHRCHLHLLFEEAGYVTPPMRADELSRRLAQQLCSVLRDLSTETAPSPTVNRIIDKLIAYKEMLPDSIFPFDLYPDEDAPDTRGRNDCRPDFQLTHPKE